MNSSKYVIRFIMQYIVILFVFVNICFFINMLCNNNGIKSICASAHINEKNDIVTLNYMNRVYTINFNDFKMHSDNFVIEKQNSKWGRNGDKKNAVFAINNIKKMGFSYDKAFEFVYKGIDKKIDAILNSVNIPPKNSKIIFTPNFVRKFYITKEKDGYMISKDDFYNLILKEYLINNNSNINITTKKVFPSITYENNIKATKLLSSFSTDISKSSMNRKNNVKKALQAFNGMRIEPEQEVSFNSTTGRRTEKKGYKNAHIIMNELFVDAVGGGVCQSSTTLYNALLLADNIQILEASRHSIPSSYVQLGFDAMVSYGASDLVFKNNSKMPIFIRTFCKNDKVGVEIYGEPNTKQYTKKRRTEIIKTINSKGDKLVLDDKGKYLDKVQYKGEKYRLKHALKGYEVQTYIDYYDGDVFVGATPIRHTTYPAQQGIIIEGVKERPLEETMKEEIENEKLE